FFYLAASGQTFTRAHLAVLLWGDAAANNARHSLRSSLYKLREALRDLAASEMLVIDSDHVRLNLVSMDCDVLRFQHLIVEGSETALREAVALFRGPFLQGFNLPDAVLFDEWVQREDSQLTRVYLAALDRLATLAEQCADWKQAIICVQ